MHQLFQVRYILAHIKQNLVENFPFTPEALVLLHSKQGRQALHIVLLRQIALQYGCIDFTIGLNDGYLLGDILQLAHITRP